MKMKGLILGAGIGSRLLPLTNEIPAPLLPIINKPLIFYIIEYLKKFGIKDFKITLYHLPEAIDAYLGDGEDFDIKISYSLERDLLETGHSLKRIPSFFDDTILIHYGNCLSSIDINDFYNFHKQKNSIFSYAVLQNSLMYNTTEIKLDQNSQIVDFSFREKSSQYPYVPTGIFLAEKEILDYIPKQEKFSLENDLPDIICKNNLPAFAYVHPGDHYWLRYPKDLIEINLHILNLLAISEQKLIFGNKSGIHNEVLEKISVPVVVGENTVIHKNVNIKGSVVIGEDVVVDEGAILSNSIILNNTYIGKNLEIENSIVYKNLCINTKSGYGIYVTEDFILAPIVKVKLSQKLSELILRLFDIVLSLVGIILLSPILLVIALAIKLDSKGPVIFKSRRIQKPHRVQQSTNWYKYEPEKIVYYYKFRTMKLDGSVENEKLKEKNIYQEGPYFKAKDDPRITKVGKFLRKMSLDELPLLFNVLKGDLSLVGVWGLPPEEAQNLYELGVRGEKLQLTDTAHLRFVGKLGLGGYWQSRGRSELSAEERVIHDSIQALASIKDEKLRARLGAYTKPNTIRGYFSLILDTIRSVIKRKGAY